MQCAREGDGDTERERYCVSVCVWVSERVCDPIPLPPSLFLNYVLLCFIFNYIYLVYIFQIGPQEETMATSSLNDDDKQPQ